MLLLSTLKYDQASDLWQQLELASELESHYKTLWTGAGCGSLISMLEQLNWFDQFDQSNNTGAISVKTDGSALEEKSYFKMLGLSFLFQIGLGLLQFLYC